MSSSFTTWALRKLVWLYYCAVCISCKAIKHKDLLKLSLELSIKKDILSLGSSHDQRRQHLTSVGFLRLFPLKWWPHQFFLRQSLNTSWEDSVHESERVNRAVYVETDVKEYKAPFVCYRSLTSALYSIILLRWMQYSTLPFTQTKPKIDWKVLELKISLAEETPLFYFKIWHTSLTLRFYCMPENTEILPTCHFQSSDECYWIKTLQCITCFF